MGSSSLGTGCSRLGSLKDNRTCQQTWSCMDFSFPKPTTPARSPLQHEFTASFGHSSAVMWLSSKCVHTPFSFLQEKLLHDFSPFLNMLSQPPQLLMGSDLAGEMFILESVGTGYIRHKRIFQ